MDEVINHHHPMHGKEAWLLTYIKKPGQTTALLKPWSCLQGEAILFFSRCSKNEGLPYCKVIDVEFCLGGPFNWAWRSVQIEALRKTVQESHRAILEAVVEKTTKARGQGLCHPWGCGREDNEGQRAGSSTQKDKAPQTSSCSLWHQGMDVRLNGRFWWGTKMEWDINHRTDQRSDHSQQRSWGHGRFKWQRAPWLPREPLGGSPSSGGNSLDGQSECRWGFPGTVANWGGLEEVLGWKSICPPLKTKRPKMLWPTAHGIGMCLCFAALVGMTVLCCPMSSDLCQDSQETWQGIWVRMPPWVMSSRCWMKHYGIVMIFHMP